MGFKGTSESFLSVYCDICQRLGCLKKEPQSKDLDLDLFKQLANDALLQGLIAGPWPYGPLPR
eukprot:1339377-Alexandrium_andersonii.AAC.1